jgi:DNA-binding response OmpR family regulator
MTQPDNTVHVLLVEDDIDLSSSLSAYLSNAGFAVTAVGSCLECYTVLSREQYQVVLVDVTLPDQSGFVLAEYLRANTSMKIIILTAHERVEDRVRGYAAGAHNYFVKPVDARELQAAIMSLVNADHPSSTGMSGEAWRLLRQSWQLKAGHGDTIKLTSLELQFLELLAADAGQVVSRNTLLNALYKRHDEHSNRALDSLVRRLRAKIVACGCPSPIMTAHAVGFCFSAPFIID